MSKRDNSVPDCAPQIHRPAPTATTAVILLHIPHGKSGDLARLHPDFPSRTTACTYLRSVPRPQDYRASFLWRRKPAYMRGDRFLQRFARRAAQVKGGTPS